MARAVRRRRFIFNGWYVKWSPKRTVKYKIFRYVGGFPDGETHEFDEFGILCRIPAEKAEFRPDQQDQSAHGIAHFRGFDGRL